MSLNLWEGHLQEKILDFVRAHQETDIFCLQEVYKDAKGDISTSGNTISRNIYDLIHEVLQEHIALFCPVVSDFYGLAIFVNKNFTIKDSSRLCVFDNPDYVGKGPLHNRHLQQVKLEREGCKFNVLNFHGLWSPQGKGDTPDRLQQSMKIREVIDNLEGPFILCGDFNLAPNTESMYIIDDGYHNLIRENGIRSTRSPLYTKPEKHADYMICGKGISPISMRVLPDVVSDHKPLYLKFSFT